MNLRSVRESSELLTSLSNTELEFFEGISSEVHLANGAILFEEGGVAESFFIVSTGKVGLELTSPGRRMCPERSSTSSAVSGSSLVGPVFSINPLLIKRPPSGYSDWWSSMVTR
jgi:hypothetical protein